MVQVFYTISVVFIASTFLLSAINTTRNWENTLGMVKARGLPQANLLLFLATLLKYVASLMMIFQFYTNVAAFGLLGFTVLATLLFDNFWSATGMERMMRYFAFLSNLSIMGGLLLVVTM